MCSICFFILHTTVNFYIFNLLLDSLLTLIPTFNSSFYIKEMSIAKTETKFTHQDTEQYMKIRQCILSSTLFLRKEKQDKNRNVLWILQSIISPSLGQEIFSPEKTAIMHIIRFNKNVNNFIEMCKTIMQSSCCYIYILKLTLVS